MPPAQGPIPLTLGLMGKLPELGDFIRLGPQVPEVRVAERWLSDGVSQLQRVQGDRWTQSYDTHLYHRFVFRGERSEHTLVGIVRAAMDAIERRHPVALYALFPTELLDAYPNLIPLMGSPLFEHLDQTLTDLVSLGHPDDLRAQIEAPLLLPPAEQAMELRYQTFLEDVTAEQMTGPDGSSGVDLLLHLTSELSALQQRHQSSRHILALPLNLPPYGWPLEVRFWLELSLTLLRWYPPWLSYTYGAPRPGAREPGCLHLSFKPPPSAFFPGMVQGNGVAPGVWGPWLKRPLSGAVGTRRIRLNLAPHHTLRQLLNFLQPGYPHTCPWNRAPLVAL